MYKTDEIVEQERFISNGQAINLHADTNRFRIASVTVNEEHEELRLTVYDSRTNTGIAFNLFPSELGVEPESEDGLPLRYVVQVVTVGIKGYQNELFSDVIHPYHTDPEDVRG